MAAVNGDITKGFRPKQHYGHTSMPMGSGTAGGTIAAYDLVADSGAGVVIKAADDPLAALLGVAAESAVSGEAVTFFMALPGVTFECTLDDDGTTGLALAQTHLYMKVAVKVDPGGSTLHFADFGDTTDTNVTVVKLVSDIGTARGRVDVMFNKSAFIG